MGLIGAGMITAIGGAKTMNLNDAAGSDKFQIKDSDGFVLFEVDSLGNLKVRGTIGKVTSQ